MRSHQYLKIKSKIRRKIEQKTACSLQKRSANSTHGRAFSAQVPDNKAHTTPGKPRSVVRPSRRAHSAKDTVKKAPTTSGALRTVGSQLRQAVPAKQAGYLSLGATYALAGKPRSEVRPSRRASSAKDTVKKAPTMSGAQRTVGSQQRRADTAKQTGYLSLGETCALAGLTLWACLFLQPVDSCSASTSAVSLKYNSRGTRDGNLSFQLRIQIPKVSFSQITKRDYTKITRKSPHSAPNRSVTNEMSRKRKRESTSEDSTDSEEEVNPPTMKVKINPKKKRKAKVVKTQGPVFSALKSTVVQYFSNHFT
jgi:hypothetical protein